MTSPRPGLVPVHVGHHRPGDGQDISRSSRPRSALTEPDVDWDKHGLSPCWNGMETNACAAALEPSLVHGSKEELDRFLRGARNRSEIALAIVTLGNADKDDPRSVMRPNTTFFLPGLDNMIVARPLPSGSRPTLAPGLASTEKDLGLRLCNRPDDAPWWALSLAKPEPGVGGPRLQREPQGELVPILLDGLGAPVAAVWIPATGDQRWYVIPDATDWNQVLGWLMHSALPTYVPDALRRARSSHFADPALQTAAESTALAALSAEVRRHEDEMARLQDTLDQATEEANAVREGLLYGTGEVLAKDVDAVLRAASFKTMDLDAELGTVSADLLATFGEHRVLVEIKSTSGSAGENLAMALQRHLSTWPQLRPDEPVSDGVLIVNHQHRLHPSLRPPHVYSRPEFVESLSTPVISTSVLFDWWRASDWAAIRDAILGSAPPVAFLDPAQPPLTSSRPKRRRWRLWSRDRAPSPGKTTGQ
ncbi:hypothetical protein [Nonomuraea jabiensis]|uniref:Uncharacterized protein n=1 Tax=Nonomuraea jabiensis TaxID=882448 RepID=A0A7W9FYR9_9ACTN|nr:hypothetical protein [Nonomuraea jabiensis]MBB5774048.1 hypothetical protein [Nonomuraea jabiensis]